MKWIRELFSPKSDASMKRFVVFVLLVYLGFYIFSAVPKPEIAVQLLGAITLLLGVAAITKT